MVSQRLTIGVLGASGFIGAALVQRSRALEVDCETFTRDHPFRSPTGLLDERLERCSVLFWLVSSIRPAQMTDAKADLTEFEALLEGLSASEHRPRIVVVSSGGTVYDVSSPPPHREASPTRAFNSYGEAMLTIEQQLRSRWQDHLVIRASNAYGPGQPARRGQGVIAHWLQALRQGEPIRIIGDPQTRRDYIFIDDLTDALFRAGTQPDIPRVLNIGSGEGTSLAELADLVGRTVGNTLTVEHLPSRTFDAPSTWLDISLARNRLNWRPETVLDEGLRRTWKWVQQSGA